MCFVRVCRQLACKHLAQMVERDGGGAVGVEEFFGDGIGNLDEFVRAEFQARREKERGCDVVVYAVGQRADKRKHQPVFQIFYQVENLRNSGIVAQDFQSRAKVPDVPGNIFRRIYVA